MEKHEAIANWKRATATATLSGDVGDEMGGEMGRDSVDLDASSGVY